MQKIVNWNKFDLYRLPTIEEFSDTFEFEYISLVKTEGISKTIYWIKSEGFKDLTIERIKQMLETGHIRVVNDTTLVYVKVYESNGSLRKCYNYPITLIWNYWMYKLGKQKGYNYSYEVINQKISKMKLYYFYVQGLNLVDNLYGIKGKTIKSISSGVHESHPIRKIIFPFDGDIPTETDKIIAEHYINTRLLVDDLYPKDSSQWVRRLGRILNINGSLYRMNSDLIFFNISDHLKDKTHFTHPFSLLSSKDEVFIYSDDEKLKNQVWNELLNSGIINKNLPDKLINSDLYKSQHMREVKKLKVPVKDMKGNELFIEGANGDAQVYQLVFSKNQQKKQDFFNSRKLKRNQKEKELEESLQVQHPKRKGKYIKLGKFPEIISISPITYKYPDKPEWKPIVKPTINQPGKSPKRLVCIISKNRSTVDRLPWEEAEKLVNEQGYSYISKAEFKKVLVPKIGRSFTATKEDNSIYQERVKFPNRNIYKTHDNTNKCIRIDTKIVENKDRDDLVEVNGIKGQYNTFITGYNEEKKCNITEQVFVPITSDLLVKTKVIVPNTKKPLRIKSHNGKFRVCASNTKLSEVFKTYKVTIEQPIHDHTGTAEYIYTIIAPNEIKAINRAYKRVDDVTKVARTIKNEKTGKEITIFEHVDFAYYKDHCEEIIKSDNLIPEKKDNPARGILVPKIIKITPEVKKGVEQSSPLTKKVFKTIKNEKTGLDETIVDNESIWEFTKYVRQFIKKIKK